MTVLACGASGSGSGLEDILEQGDLLFYHQVFFVQLIVLKGVLVIL